MGFFDSNSSGPTRPSPRRPRLLDTDDRLPPSTASWVPSGTKAVLAGRSIRCGLFYLDAAGVEPDAIGSMIILGGAHRLDWRGWTLAQRERYVAWLDAGRPDYGETLELFVRHMLAGFERHILCAAEEPLLLADLGAIKRIAERFAASTNVDRETASRCTQICGLVSVASRSLLVWPADEDQTDGPASRMGQRILEGEAIPLESATELIRSVHVRENVRAEFDELFRLRYVAHGGVSPIGVDAEILYYPLNPSLPDRVSIWVSGDPLPESEAAAQIRDLAHACISALRRFGDIVELSGRREAYRTAVARLPLELLRLNHPDVLLNLTLFARGQLGARAYVTVPWRQLLKVWPCASDAGVASAEAMATVLSENQIGVEPDVRLYRSFISLDASVTLFPLTAELPNSERHQYVQAAMLVPAVVAAARARMTALPQAVVDRLAASTSAAMNLGAAATERLRYRVIAHAASPPERISKSNAAPSSLIATILKNTGIHHMTAIARPLTMGEVASQPGFLIPRPQTPKTSDSLEFDEKKIDELRLESLTVEGMLADVFVDSPTETQVQDRDVSRETRMLAALAVKPEWSLEEYELLAASHDLYSGAAAEQINALSEKFTGEAVLIIDESVTVDCVTARLVLEKATS